ncbi:hypothetical protein [Streptomyces sp. NPDC055749]
MSRRLCTAVHLVDPVTREHVVLLPGEEPREALAELITSPGPWQDDGYPEVIEVPTMSEPDAVIVSSEPEPEEAEAVKTVRRRKPVKTEADLA